MHKLITTILIVFYIKMKNKIKTHSIEDKKVCILIGVIQSFLSKVLILLVFLNIFNIIKFMGISL